MDNLHVDSNVVSHKINDKYSFGQIDSRLNFCGNNDEL